MAAVLTWDWIRITMGLMEGTDLLLRSGLMCAHDWHMNGCCTDIGLDKNNQGPHGRSQLPVQDWVTCADDWQLLIG